MGRALIDDHGLGGDVQAHAFPEPIRVATPLLADGSVVHED
jgi:hypothetical protein